MRTTRRRRVFRFHRNKYNFDNAQLPDLISDFYLYLLCAIKNKKKKKKMFTSVIGLQCVYKKNEKTIILLKFYVLIIIIFQTLEFRIVIQNMVIRREYILYKNGIREHDFDRYK